MTHPLHVHRFGADGPVRVLAIHGLTGHGRRWRTLVNQHLPEIAVAAPDLIGHGRSSWSAPWTIDANIAALATLVEDAADGPVLVVGHSFGGAIALHLAAACPDLVSGLVLLDPAIGLDGQWMREIAEDMLESPDYTDRDEARTEKFTGSWADVDPAELDADLDEHLLVLPNGRYGWRICVPAMMSYWSELARDIVLPHKGTPTTLIRAQWTDPPYVGAELIDGLSARLGADFTLVEFACQHMVAHAKPEETAKVIRDVLGAQ
ncbi:alpha/beta hydrolase [Mycobacterium sp. CVI_P3]|uniref:Alpha/beta hydrolase n=1 Tax=Mycobacterium pinniadriaticum TaxID=2994102 RepID=A0ABT3SMW2_9MYCO|nr:alpha/beta hydrolase [Mycobacterium pinniadriaticum]MCX2934370.1 alpha/beta hydrolase [Mycobacterium pinniadriaticum]MCX2940793.1 alpha/beta hydrolase [Mycobacterium pinniadriaticum]